LVVNRVNRDVIVLEGMEQKIGLSVLDNLRQASNSDR
jgi:hypothetical protein